MKQPVRPIPALQAEEEEHVNGVIPNMSQRPLSVCGYLQWTITGPTDTAARLSVSTSVISCSSGMVESGVLWSGHDVYQ